MATTKTTTPRSARPRPPPRACEDDHGAGKQRAQASRPTIRSSRAPAARSSDRPYTSAAIATGAVTVVAAAAAGARSSVSRRDKALQGSQRRADEPRQGRPVERQRDGQGRARQRDRTVKDLASAAPTISRAMAARTGETRSQHEIAEEALTLKETGEAKSPVDDLSATEIKTGAVAY